MSNDQNSRSEAAIAELYAEAAHYEINVGDKTIHAKRMPGKWRTIKWLSASVWLLFFIGPYLRWGDRQAVLFDIPGRQFHIFGATIMPQDFWMLSLLLLFFAILLAVATALAGRGLLWLLLFSDGLDRCLHLDRGEVGGAAAGTSQDGRGALDRLQDRNKIGQASYLAAYWPAYRYQLGRLVHGCLRPVGRAGNL